MLSDIHTRYERAGLGVTHAGRRWQDAPAAGGRAWLRLPWTRGRREATRGARTPAAGHVTC